MDQLSKNQIFATHGIAAAGSVILGTAVTYPLDTIKVLIQVGSNSGKQLTTAQVLKRIQSLSGNAGLYSGIGWLASGRILGLGARFGIYEILTAFYKDGREDNYVYTSEALMAGMAAGAAETLVSSPFELIKLRAQVTSASQMPSSTLAIEKGAVAPLIGRVLQGCFPDTRALNHSVGLLSTLTTKYTNMMGALQEYPWMMTGSGRPPSVSNVRRPSDIISLEGWGALWRDLRSGIVRDSIFGGIFFSSWQFLHRTMLDWKAVGMDPPPRSDEEIGPLSPLAVSLAAGFSGSVAAAASHGFDTARSRSQCIVQPKYLSMERRLLKWTRPGNRFERVTGIHPADRNLLFRGILLRMARCGIGSFFIVGGYFLTVNHVVSSLN
ncbi:Mitochondrial substrate carrier family protein [Quillaja saponaria]|uniref:Mitochondrial substrate carrier family protein n=1 Tax=Quillaja saponaria TaxID=32244 RepID=A0AAD7M1H1_QUISA|nr:Mitochondrial substrate carrier family protein [Quillaja saponaria]